MRRRMLLASCCAMAGLGTGPPAASAALEVVAPATGVTGQTYPITVRGAGPFGASVRFHAVQGTTCTAEYYADRERASGPFAHTFAFAQATPGPWALCARLLGADDPDDAPGLEQAAAVIVLSAAQRTLTLTPVRPVYALGEPVEVRVHGHTDVETMIWAWPQPLDGPPCTEAPWVGDRTFGEVRGSSGTRIALRHPITVPGTYRVCAHLYDAGSQDAQGVLETQVVVSQACTDAQRLRDRRTAGYRRARAAYRRARGARRARARRVMVERRAAMDRARARVRADC